MNTSTSWPGYLAVCRPLSLVIAITCTSLAVAESPAKLGQPIVRAVAGDETTSDETPKRPERTDYPPAYSRKKEGLFGSGGSIKKIFLGSGEKTPAKADTPAPAAKADSVKPFWEMSDTPKEAPASKVAPARAERPIDPPAINPVPAKPGIAPVPVQFKNPPAWRWYGYGTITQSGAPVTDSPYTPAPSEWLETTKATPGAVPQNAVTGDEAVAVETPRSFPPFTPLSTSSKMSANGDIEIAPGVFLPPPLPPTGSPLVQKDPRGGTTIVFPVPSSRRPAATLQGTVRPASPDSLSQNTEKNPPSQAIPPRQEVIVRAAAPQPPVPRAVTDPTFPVSAELIDKIRRAAPMATDFDVRFTETMRMNLRFTVPRQNEAERAANLIAEVPELARFYLDFDIKVK